MYHRDFAILALSIFAVYFVLQNEGPFLFRKAWYFPLAEDYSHFGGKRLLPLPVTVDLNGDGNLEIVMVTLDRRLVVLRSRTSGNEGEGFAMADLLHEVSLDLFGSHLTNSRRAVALSAGYIDSPHKDLVTRPRKAVIVVMTSSWHVMCFDHTLKLLWEHNIHEEIDFDTRIHEVSILITNHTVFKDDRGLVVIGGSLNLGSKFDFETVLNKEEVEEDFFEAEEKAEEREFEQMKQLEKGDVEDPLKMEQMDGADISRHFSFYAYDGGTGTSRWRHVGSDFKRDLEDMKENLVPQHYYKLRAEQLESPDFSEVSCRDYRESILHNLPHQWNQRIDTSMALSHFEKHKISKGPRKKELASNKQTPTRKAPCPKGKCPKNALSNTIEKISDKALSGGRVSTSQSKPKNYNPTTALPPNAIVAHLKEGIHVVHLFSGRSICKLHLPDGGLHVDLNGDGVLDHIQTSSGGSSEWMRNRGHHRIPECFAYAMSGVPPREPFFNGSICERHWGESFGGGNAFLSNQDHHGGFDTAPPAMLPIPTPRGHYRFRYGQRGYAIFLNSRGEITAFNSKGRKEWTIFTDCQWANAQRVHMKMQPTLRAFPVRPDALPTTILAAGAHQAIVVSEQGHILSSFNLPDQPIVPLQIMDFNGDGLNDIVLIGRRNVYGYVQMRDLGGRPFGMLVLCLIVAMGTIYAAQHTSKGPSKSIKRSTD